MKRPIDEYCSQKNEYVFLYFFGGLVKLFKKKGKLRHRGIKAQREIQNSD
jgi:hypothetical protein